MNSTFDMKKPQLVKKLKSSIKSGKVKGISLARASKLRKSAVCRALGIKNTSCHVKYTLKMSTASLRAKAKKAGKPVSVSRAALCKSLGFSNVSMATLFKMCARKGLKVKVGMKKFQLINMLSRAGVKSVRRECNKKVGAVRRPRVARKGKKATKKVAKKH